MNLKSSLPDPDPTALERCREIEALLQRDIAQSATRSIGFDQFMARALYEPELGYYVSENEIFGADGDFITAPESGSIFSNVIGHWCESLLPHAGDRLLEFGAGTGQLALDICKALLRRAPDSDWHYTIVDRSERLVRRQRERFERELPEALSRITWYLELPSETRYDIVIANEVVDAMPARRWEIQDSTVAELAVGFRDGHFHWSRRDAVEAPAEILSVAAQLPSGYRTESIPGLAAWLKEVRDVIDSGVLLLLDYGYPRHEYLHASRTDGTLKCHYKHHVHGDPFFYPGAQDITVCVDFSTVADIAFDAGFEIAGFTSQAHFLLGNDVENVMRTIAGDDPVKHYELAQQAKTLLLPGEMGETVKVMACTAGGGITPGGFEHDLRYRLGGFAEAQGI